MRIAFVGGSGHHYLRQALSPGDVVGFATDPFDVDASDACSIRLPDARRFDDLDALLATFRPDVVSVGTVYGHAGDAVAACLARDVPVVCDKPVAATWAQFERVRSLCERDASRTLVTEFDFRARPAFRAARAAVRAGAAGTVALVVAQKSYRWGDRPAWYARRADYGSTLLWIASHAIDAVRFVTGLEPTSVYARQANVTRGDAWGTAEDVATATYGLPGGGTAIVHADFLRPTKAESHGDDRFRLVGDRGQVAVANDRCVLTTNDAGPADVTDAQTPGLPGKELLAAALSGGNECFSTAESLRSAELLLRSRDAADAGTVVTL